MFFPNYKVSYIVGRKRYVGGQRKGGWWSKQAKLCQRFEVGKFKYERSRFFFHLYLCSRQKGFCLLLTLLVVFDYSFSCKKSPMF